MIQIDSYTTYCMIVLGLILVVAIIISVFGWHEKGIIRAFDYGRTNGFQDGFKKGYDLAQGGIPKTRIELTKAGVKILPKCYTESWFIRLVTCDSCEHKETCPQQIITFEEFKKGSASNE